MKTMKVKKIVYIIGGIVCGTLTIIFRTVTLPVALAYEALDAMGDSLEETTDELMENIKGIE